MCFQRFFDSRILPRTHFSPLGCATRNQTADTYHERAALWKSETPPPGQQQLPRSLTRNGVVGVVTVTPVVPEERLEDPCQNQHHRPQAPHFSELPAEISRFAVANDHRSQSSPGRSGSRSEFFWKDYGNIIRGAGFAPPLRGHGGHKHAFSLRPRVFELCVIASCHRPSLSLSLSLRNEILFGPLFVG